MLTDDQVSILLDSIHQHSDNPHVELITLLCLATGARWSEAEGFTSSRLRVLAEVLHVQQPAIAKMERCTDMYISTLRSHIEAMGGQLEVIARFPDGSVKISNFADLESDVPQQA